MEQAGTCLTSVSIAVFLFKAASTWPSDTSVLEEPEQRTTSIETWTHNAFEDEFRSSVCLSLYGTPTQGNSE